MVSPGGKKGRQMSSTEQKVFTRLVFPWDAAHKNHYKCVATMMPGTDKPRWIHHATQDWNDLDKLIDARNGWPNSNVYVAMGIMTAVGTRRTVDGLGYDMGGRPGSNMAAFNALWMDLDVKPGEYTSTAEAQQELERFIAASGMPKPTMRVLSGGGGIHVYWCTDRPMPKDEWLPLATALKQSTIALKLKNDAGIIADAARILRVPGTDYRKPGKTPSVVHIDQTTLTGNQYPVDTLRTALAKYMNASVQQKKPGTGATVSQLGANFTSEVDWPRIPIDQIAKNCPMTAETLATGGADKSEPQWSDDVFLAAWTLDPVDAAHRLSSGHVGYSKAATDQKLIEKQSAIAAGQLGWPLCSTFSAKNTA